MELHERLRAERERLGLTQPEMGDVTGVGKTTVINWEKGTSSPTAIQLGELAKRGFKVMWIITGKHTWDGPELDVSRRAILDSFERCSPTQQITAIQQMALLAAGVEPPASGKGDAQGGTHTKVSKSFMSMAIGNVGRRSPKK